jgi:hypothetical protein
MRGGFLASAYRGSLRLADADIDALGFERLRGFLDGLPALFPGWDGFPLSVRQVLLDLAWNCGIGHRPGLADWLGLRAACNQVPPDWLAASKECTTANPGHFKGREARNAYRARGFLLAAGVTPGPT